MSRIPGTLARRIDRLSRQAHRFHRFAHHPLCGAYSGELIALGRKARLCRGCTMVFGGLPLGAIAGALPVTESSWRAAAGWMAASCAMLIGALLAKRGNARLPKLATRFLPAFFGGAAIGAALRVGLLTFVPVTGIGLGAAGAFIAMYRRRGPDRTPCTTCPERLLNKPCSGLLPIVQRERAFRRLTSRWLSGL
ncbi:MAG TPA: hypothetical protein VGL13_12650 [Polyangiaceae bacterium]